MSRRRIKKVPGNILLNILFVVLFILLELVGVIIDFNRDETRLLIRVIARGVFGILILYNSAHLLFTKNPSFIDSSGSTKKRIFVGILLGFVGLITVITAFLGYGVNGDPVLRWWEL